MAKRSPSNVLDSAGEMAESAMPSIDAVIAGARPFLKAGKKIAKQKTKQARKAVKAELKAAQEALNTRLEAELVQTLRLRLQTALSESSS